MFWNFRNHFHDKLAYKPIGVYLVLEDSKTVLTKPKDKNNSANTCSEGRDIPKGKWNRLSGVEVEEDTYNSGIGEKKKA